MRHVQTAVRRRRPNRLSSRRQEDDIPPRGMPLPGDGAPRAGHHSGRTRLSATLRARHRIRRSAGRRPTRASRATTPRRRASSSAVPISPSSSPSARRSGNQPPSPTLTTNRSDLGVRCEVVGPSSCRPISMRIVNGAAAVSSWRGSWMVPASAPWVLEVEYPGGSAVDHVVEPAGFVRGDDADLCQRCVSGVAGEDVDPVVGGVVDVDVVDALAVRGV